MIRLPPPAATPPISCLKVTKMAYVTLDGIPVISGSLMGLLRRLAGEFIRRRTAQKAADLRRLSPRLLEDIGATPALQSRGGWGLLYR